MGVLDDLQTTALILLHPTGETAPGRLKKAGVEKRESGGGREWESIKQ